MPVHQKPKFFHGSDLKLAGPSAANVCHHLPAFATFTLLQDMYKRAEDDGHTCADGYKKHPLATVIMYTMTSKHFWNCKTAKLTILSLAVNLF